MHLLHADEASWVGGGGVLAWLSWQAGGGCAHLCALRPLRIVGWRSWTWCRCGVWRMRQRAGSWLRPACRVAEETKLEMISAWMNSSGRGRGASSDRTAFFDLLLPTVDLQRVSHDFFLSMACDEALADLPSSCKPVLAKARREALSASTSRPSHRYAACLPAFPNCNFFLPSLRPIGSRLPFRTRQVVYVYGLEKGDSGRWTLSTLPWDQQRKLQLKAPSRNDASVVMLEGR